MNTANQQPIVADTEDDEDLSLLELLAQLGQQKWAVLFCSLAFAGAGVGYALWAKPVFTAQATVLVPRSAGGGGAAAMASALGAAGAGQLAALAGAPGLGGGDDFYPALLRSRAVGDLMVERMKLQERWSLPSPEAARNRAMGAVGATFDRKSGLLTINGSGSTAEEAAAMANGAVEGLQGLLGRLAVTEAQSRRMFFEREFERTQQALAKAETTFLADRDKAGLQSFTAIAEVGLRTSIELRAQVLAKEMELQGMRQFAGPQHPDVQRLNFEIRTLQGELRKLEQGQGSTQKLSAQHAQALQSFRELKMQEAMMEGYARQIAAARFDEAREGPVVQLVDVAEPPKLRAKPERKKIVLIAAGMGLLLGLVVAGLRVWILQASANPLTGQRLTALRTAWLGRR